MFCFLDLDLSYIQVPTRAGVYDVKSRAQLHDEAAHRAMARRERDQWTRRRVARCGLALGGSGSEGLPQRGDASPPTAFAGRDRVRERQ